MCGLHFSILILIWGIKTVNLFLGECNFKKKKKLNSFDSRTKELLFANVKWKGEKWKTKRECWQRANIEKNIATKQYIYNILFKLNFFEILVSVKEFSCSASYTSVIHCNENLEPCNSLFLKCAFMPTSLIIIFE